MSTLLIGHWDGDDLLITGSYQVRDGDQETIDNLVAGVERETGGLDLWAVEFDVSSHREAVQRTYDEYIRDLANQLLDEVEDFEPNTF